jgi:hypothetical protein
MTVSCGTITVWKPANITATDITYSTTDCDEPCDVIITITWTNTGGRAQTITPGIIIDDVRTAGTSITLAKAQTATQIFNITGLTEGVHTVCPDPN